MVRACPGTPPSSSIVTEVAGSRVTSTAQLLNAVAALKPGEPAQVKVQRGDKEVVVSIVTATRPQVASRESGEADATPEQDAEPD